MIDLKKTVRKKFRRFGVNKIREITRLVYEVSKRDKAPYNKIISDISDISPDYSAIKKSLLKRRFPYASNLNKPLMPYLPKLDCDPKNKAITANQPLYPKNVYIEESVSTHYLARRLEDAFPFAKFNKIKSLKDYLKNRKSGGFSIQDYNKRRDNFFVVKERHDFFKKCPCTRLAVSCGYHILNLGFGCVYECSYCYLQEYTNCPGIILPSNIEDFFKNFNAYKRPGMRIGTGEFTDSLALDDITQYSLPLIEFFGFTQGVTFEFKTKSANIGNILKAPHKGNIVISWSLNPETIVKENEFRTASLEKRLNSALECVRAGYKVGFHFDPIIYHSGWSRQYQKLVNRLFDKIPHRHIAWISLGTLRFNPRLKSIIENRFPDNRILGEEMLIGFDKKLRYPEKLRVLIYKDMLYWIRKRAKSPKVYTCMEEKDIMSICS